MADSSQLGGIVTVLSLSRGEEMSQSVRTMLLVLAHPDDEAFGMAGTIARYVTEGVEVSLICTTNGDVGTVEPRFLENHKSTADLRLTELDCAAQILGIKQVYTLGYRDSGMAGTPDNSHPDSLFASDKTKLIEKITKIMRQVRPQVTVTFDPYGGYGHPDHIVTHEATVEAFYAAADKSRFANQFDDGLKPHQGSKLYFMTFDRRWLRLWIRLAPLFLINPRKMGRNHDIDASEIAAHSYPIHATINTNAYKEIAQRARKCHASQLGGIGPRRMSEMLSRLVFGLQEHYTRAYPPVRGRLRETDLFQDF